MRKSSINQKMDAIVRKQLLDLCVDIGAHADMDSEITLNGCSTSAAEAWQVARSILYILCVEEDNIKDAVKNRIRELDETGDFKELYE